MFQEDIRVRVADAIVAAGCVGIIAAGEAPKIFAASWASPVYCDMRRLLGAVSERDVVFGELAALIRAATPGGHQAMVDGRLAIVGGETAGIAYAAFMAAALGAPNAYVRKEAKGHGTKKRVEGGLEVGCQVVLVEDIMTDGGSKLSFVEALAQEGHQVTDIVVPVFYDCFPGALGELAARGIACHWLVTWADLLEACRRCGRFTAEQLEKAAAFLAGPVEWSAAHGGRSA